MNVFLSYSSRDTKVARALAAKLSGAGFKVWDPGEEIVPGDNWALELGRALSQADAMVVLLSPAALAESHVRREIEYALGNPRFKGRLLPVVVRPVKDVPWILETLPTVRIASDPGRSSRQVIEALKKIRAA